VKNDEFHQVPGSQWLQAMQLLEDLKEALWSGGATGGMDFHGGSL